MTTTPYGVRLKWNGTPANLSLYDDARDYVEKMGAGHHVHYFGSSGVVLTPRGVGRSEAEKAWTYEEHEPSAPSEQWTIAATFCGHEQSITGEGPVNFIKALGRLAHEALNNY